MKKPAIKTAILTTRVYAETLKGIDAIANRQKATRSAVISNALNSYVYVQTRTHRLTQKKSRHTAGLK